MEGQSWVNLSLPSRTSNPCSVTQPIPSTTQPSSLPTTFQSSFSVIDPTSSLCTLNQQQNSILKSSQTFSRVWQMIILSTFPEFLITFHGQHHLFSFLPRLPSPYFNNTANPLPSPDNHPQQQSLLLTQPFWQLLFYNYFPQFSAILMVRYYFNYLYFHTLAIIPTDTTISDVTVRIFVASPRFLSDSRDLSCVEAQRLMVMLSLG